MLLGVRLILFSIQSLHIDGKIKEIDVCSGIIRRPPSVKATVSQVRDLTFVNFVTYCLAGPPGLPTGQQFLLPGALVLSASLAVRATKLPVFVNFVVMKRRR